MVTEKMTLTRALVQLKLLDKRIHKAKDVSFITYKVGDEIKDPKCEPQAAMDSIKSLIERYSDIKSALMAANAATTITIGEEEMSIASAIEKKKTIEYQKELLTSMTKQFMNVKREVERNNADMQYRLDELLRSNFSKDLKARDEEVEMIAKPFEKRNKADLIDTIDLEKRMDELAEYIDTFEAEVDLCLSEANAVTYIDV